MAQVGRGTTAGQRIIPTEVSGRHVVAGAVHYTSQGRPPARKSIDCCGYSVLLNIGERIEC